jgi:hypothetical protein
MGCSGKTKIIHSGEAFLMQFLLTKYKNVLMSYSLVVTAFMSKLQTKLL